MKDLILLNAKTQPGLRWLPPSSFAFVRGLPLLPAQASEAGKLASALPLALCRDADQPSGWNLMAVCGVAPDASALVDGDGKWLAGVLPDALRYLPFAVQELGRGKGLAAIHPRYAGGVLAQGDEGVPVYGDDGTLHPAARKRVDFLKEYQPRIQRTQGIVSALSQAGLISPWPDSLIKAGNISIEGLHTIDEKALAALDDEAFLALRKSGALAVAYSCLLSLYQVRSLARPKSSQAAKPGSETAVQSTGDLDLEFLNNDDTIKFGPLH